MDVHLKFGVRKEAGNKVANCASPNGCDVAMITSYKTVSLMGRVAHRHGSCKGKMELAR